MTEGGGRECRKNEKALVTVYEKLTVNMVDNTIP